MYIKAIKGLSNHVLSAKFKESFRLQEVEAISGVDHESLFQKKKKKKINC